MKFTFPVPGPLEGVKSRTKAILQAKNITFTYPTPEEKALGPSCKTRSGKPTLQDVSVQVSQASRIACIGPNGAGKSTLIKVLVGETKPDEGCPEVYRHQNCRIAYVAQHAFHHIEQHLEMSPVEYIQWRFSGGLDKEQQAMEAAQMSEEEKAQLKQPFIVYLKELAAELDEAGNATGEREIIFEKMEPLKKGQKPPPAPRRLRVRGQVGRQGDDLHGPEEQPVRAQGRPRDARLPQAHEGRRRQDRRRVGQRQAAHDDGDPEAFGRLRPARGVRHLRQDEEPVGRPEGEMCDWRVHVVLPAHSRARRADELPRPRLARRPLARHQGVPGRR